MRTETDPTEDQKPWKPFGEKVVPPTSERDEWAPVPDAPGVEISYKTGMRRTNVRVPNAWVEDLAMQAKDKRATIGCYLDSSTYRYWAARVKELNL